MQACFLTCRMGCHGVNSRATGPTVPSSLWSVLGGSVGPPGGAGTGFSSVAGPGLGSTGGRFWEHTLLFALSAQLLELNRRTLGILLLPPVSGGCALMSPSPRLCFQVSRLPSVCVKSPPQGHLYWRGRSSWMGTSQGTYPHPACYQVRRRASPQAPGRTWYLRLQSYAHHGCLPDVNPTCKLNAIFSKVQMSRWYLELGLCGCLSCKSKWCGVLTTSGAVALKVECEGPPCATPCHPRCRC